MTDEERLELYKDQLVEELLDEEIKKDALEFIKSPAKYIENYFESPGGNLMEKIANFNNPTQIVSWKKERLQKEVAEQVAKDPASKGNAIQKLGGMKEEDLKEKYQKKYMNESDKEEKDKSREEKAQEREKYKKDYQSQYEEYNRMRELRYNQEKNKTGLQHTEEPSAAPNQTGKMDKIVKDLSAYLKPQNPAIQSAVAQFGNKMEQYGDFMKVAMKEMYARLFPQDPESIAKRERAREEYELEHVVPLEPEYLIKQFEMTPQYSRYTFVTIKLSSQIFWTEISILLGLVAILTAIPTAGGSMILLAVAEAGFGVASVYVGTKKAADLYRGDIHTDPTFAGLNQQAIDLGGIILGERR